MNPKLRVATVSIASNAGLVTTELAISWFTGSLAVLADAFHSGVDLTGSLVAFMGIRMALRTADRRYAYGYGRYENAAALIQFVLIAIIGVVVILEAGRRFLEGFAVDVTLFAIGAVLATFAFDLLLYRYISRKSRTLESYALEADSYHFATDAIGKIGVLFGIGMAYLGYPVMDLVGAGAIAVSFLVAAFLMGRKNLQVLTDASPPREVMEGLKRVALAVPSVEGVHSIRGRQSGTKVFVDLVVHVRSDTPFEEAHRVAHAVEEAILAGVPNIADVIVHVEPAQHDGTLDDRHAA